MRSLIKNLTLFVFLCIAFSGLAACTKTRTSSNSSSGETSNNAVGEKDESGNLEVSAAVMQSKLTAPDGSSFNLQDYRGKIILVNFWATWCAPCRDEMPGLVKIQDEFKDKNFVIIGVNADQEEADVIKNFGEKMNLNYKLVTADDEFLHGLLDISQAGAIPQTFLINREGKVTAGWVGGGPKTLAEIKESVSKLVNSN